MRNILRLYSLLSLLSMTLLAQRWEVGAAGGYGLSRDLTVTNGSISGKVGFRSGLAFGAVFGNETTRHFGGEARYTYRSQDLRVSSGSTRPTLGAESHAVHYDLLIHAASGESRARPFVAMGGGIKYYRGTGAETPFQPLSNLVVLTRTNEVQPLVSIGGGIKVPISRHSLIRLDFRDYMTPFPSSLLAFPGNTRGKGWVHDFVLMVGISGIF
jgi:hypothetical protein